MVLELMINPKNAENKPFHIFVIAAIYTVVAAGVSYFLFPTQASVLTVAMITIIFTPFFQKMFVLEEKREDRAAAKNDHHNLLARHQKSIKVYTAFFLGVIVAMSFIFIFFDNQAIFALQSQTIQSFSTGSATENSDFGRYFINNTQVMLLMFALSVLFGAGAILVLAWNASVIAVYTGLLAKTISTNTAVAYLYGVPVGLFSIALHGIPEIMAYFVAGLAGGILSVGLVREKFGSKNFKLVFKDSLKFMFVAEFLIFIAALIEAL
jgi:uncharacterized membrane protein SpoIIM required for sporulation